MIAPRGRGTLLGFLILFLSARSAGAGDVEIEPFGGVQFGGSVESVASGRSLSLGAGFVYGASLDVRIGESWGLEALYSRQGAELSGDAATPRLELTVERYLAGVREEKGEGRARFIGTFLLGITRFAPGFDGFDSDVRFTIGLGLGVKTMLSKRFGLRAEARGFFVAIHGSGATVCISGTCLFRFSTSGVLQGDLSAGVVIAF
jgi:hypothetical protein